MWPDVAIARESGLREPVAGVVPVNMTMPAIFRKSGGRFVPYCEVDDVDAVERAVAEVHEEVEPDPMTIPD
ncbi:MAG: hypothetical protein OEW79_07035 [Betaproteobacteria bacterium]|jgi:hypothetical protein|nr:hypothetical protein [Betaproteobacteria bacterium]MDH4294023.1 hypothetical protein [Betaproteobacteria bacterium]MDH5342570.1 hypothetical protein [Betaproteobacteria bacterium]